MAEAITNDKKRLRDDSLESDADSPEAKRIRDDLLEILNDSELAGDRTSAAQDLASVIKSFEEEIVLPFPSQPPVSDVTSDSGESQPDLGYLFEASDDELGLPPAFSEEDVKNEKEENVSRIPFEAIGYDQIWRYEDENPSYEFGIGESYSCGEFLALDGLFDYSDVFSGQSDFSDFLYRPESLPAL